MAVNRSYGDATIAAAGSLSGAVVTAGALTIQIELPTWDSAAVTFQGQGSDRGTFVNVYDELGVEVTLPASTGARSFPVPYLVGYYAIKVRSGTAASAVAQTTAEVVKVSGLA